jgi:probable HAF family extracellular repeat protein
MQENGGKKMKRMNSQFFFSLYLILFLGSAGIDSAIAQNYTLTDLGTLGGKNSYAADINDLGQIVGNSDTVWCESRECDRQPHAFIWTPEDGTLQDLGTLGGRRSYAYAINNSGQIVGQSQTLDDYNSLAFIWGSTTGMGSMGTLPDGSTSAAFSINRDGRVTGNSEILWGADFNVHAFHWTSGSMTDLGTLPGGAFSYGTSINNHGKVVGHGATDSSAAHAFLWENGMMTDLQTLGGTDSYAFRINNLGQVVGYSFTNGNEAAHAFLWENGAMIDLGTLGGNESEALAINDLSQVVGVSTTETGYSHAFLWQDGRMWDLNELIQSGSGWELVEAAAINKQGQIVGWGYRDLNGDGTFDGKRAFLLTPIEKTVETIKVKIDIWHRNSSNIIHYKLRWGLIPVAILSTADFLAPDMVDRTSLTFGHAGDEKSLAFCNRHHKDANHDGLKDLVCYFYTRYAGFQCGDTEGILRGKTKESTSMEITPIEGRDSVKVVPCKKPKHHGKYEK